MQKKKKTMLIAAVLLIIGLGIAFIVLRPKRGDTLAQYDFSPVKRMNLRETVDATGKVLATEKKELYPDFDGTVDTVHKKAGATVKQGEPLLTIESTTLNSQLREASTALKQAQINLAQVSAQLATEIALNKVTKNNAQQIEVYTHQAGLYKEQVKQAEKQVKDLKARNDGIAADGKLIIRAPFDGQVAWVDVTKGDRVTPQTRLVTVMKPDSLSVEAEIDENDINMIDIGQNVEIIGRDTAQSVNMGTITEISTQGRSSLDTGLVNTSTSAATSEIIDFPVRIELTDASQGLRPGMSVDVTVLTVERQNVLAVPTGSIVQNNGKSVVKVRRGDQVVPVAVKLGLKSGKFQEVQGGLKAGDQVAVAKPPALKGTSASAGGRQRMGHAPMGR